MLLGQDECIFKQYLFTNSTWVLPDGSRPLIPKEEGQGIMLSSFTCRELGYGYKIDEDKLKKVNKNRQNQSYNDENAAIKN